MMMMRKPSAAEAAHPRSGLRGGVRPHRRFATASQSSNSAARSCSRWTRGARARPSESSIGVVAGASASDSPRGVPAEESSATPSRPLDLTTGHATKAARAIEAAMAAGVKRMEVEFPPIQGGDAYASSSDAFIDGNVAYAISIGRRLLQSAPERVGRVRVVVPDDGELQRSRGLNSFELERAWPDVSMGSLSEASDLEGFRDATRAAFNALSEAADKLLGQESNPGIRLDDRPRPPPGVNTFIIVNASCSELADLTRYVERCVPSDATIVLMNLELETLRGDLGLPAFPPKDVHYDFLSQFKPVYFIRLRDYSKTISVSPYLVNYSGAIYREYPGEWQVLLQQSESGKKGEGPGYVAVDSDPSRYTLTEAKFKMMEAMGLRTEEEGGVAEFFRMGYQRTTWWENPDDFAKEASDSWRT